MTPLDWLALTIGVLTLVGLQFTPGDRPSEAQRPDARQALGVPGGTARLLIAGEPVCAFADSGVMGATERAMLARQQVGRAIVHFDLSRRYAAHWLHVDGDDTLAFVGYLDLPLVTASAADARLNGAPGARALAERWRIALHGHLARVPAPMPAAWLAVAGALDVRAGVTSDTLARAVAGALPSAAAGVQVAAIGGHVTLTGRMPGEVERRRLLALVRSVPGVSEVEDRLIVAP